MPSNIKMLAINYDQKKDFEYSDKEFRKSFKRIVYNLREPISVTQFVEGNRVMPQSTPFPGLVDMSLTPYLKELQDIISGNVAVNEVAFMKAAQQGATFLIENILMYIIGHSPCPVMYASANEALLKKWVDNRLEPAIESCDLRSRIFSQIEGKSKNRKGDKIMNKEFVGGTLNLASMQSGASLRSDSVRVLLLDELDGAPLFLKNEGDPAKIASARTQAWGNRKLIFYISTPTTELESKINALYLIGDQRRFYVPCLRCGLFQVLELDNLKWDKDEEGSVIKDSTRYECCECKKHIMPYEKFEMIKEGEWRPTAKPKKNRFRSYQLSSLYSPPGMDDWESIAEKFTATHGDKVELRSFVNLVLGEPWREVGESAKYEEVCSKRDDYSSGKVPPEALCLTIGADVQRDRIECEIAAWGNNKRSWSIQYFVFPAETKTAEGKGDVELDDFESESSCWEKLKQLILHGIDDRPIFMSFIDGGYATNKVYDFCSQFSSGVHPVMGEGRHKYQYKKLFQARDVAGHDVIRYDLNTDMLKDELSSYLRKEKPLSKSSYPRGYCHFPKDYPIEYFKQLTAEEKFEKTAPNGAKYYVWMNRKNRANEALDCRVYNMAALYVLASLVCADLEDDDSKKDRHGVSWDVFWEEMLNSIN